MVKSRKARPSPRRSRKPKQSIPEGQGPFEVTIEAMGDRGDGLARHPETGRTVYVAGAFPGDHISAKPQGNQADGLRATLLDILSPSPDRLPAPLPCPHVGSCGGCPLMGWAPNAQARDKRERILKALKRHGFSKGELETKLPETLSLPGQGQRQRLSVGLSSTGAVGFHTRRDTTIVDVPNCLLPVPRLAEDLAGLRRVWHQLAAATSTALPTGTALLTSSDSGTDILMTLAKDPDLAVREALGRFAAERDLARLTLSIDGLQEPLAHRRPVHHRLAGTAITFPPGPFLQPSAIGQSSLIEHVQRALEGLTPGIGLDLFCGLGTFTLPLAAQGWRMQAIDIDPASISHLSQAGVAGLSAQSQNLFSDPLPPDMLSRCDGIVFDPPRAGAALVCETIAALPMASGPKRVVAVSCNPATFARDAKILRQGGWELVWLAPIDQFPWTPHVELVARFDRTTKGQKARTISL